MFDAASITTQEVVLTILYSIAGLGIAIVNDFKVAVAWWHGGVRVLACVC